MSATAADGRRGHSLAEILVSMVLLVFLASVGWKVLEVHRAAAVSLTTRAERLEMGRTIGWVLARELRRTGPSGRGAVAGDSVALRAFRGGGAVCEASGGGVAVRRVGTRAPDPAKDSVLVLGAEGRWTAHALLKVEGSVRCAPGAGVAEIWTLHPAPDSAPVLARYFERGSYHLAAGALRYRRGLSGRQPLTAAVLGSGSGLESNGDAVRAVLRWDGATGPTGPRVLTFRPPVERAPSEDPTRDADGSAADGRGDAGSAGG